MPSFNNTAASTTEPAVGACVCASGSHVCSGTTGTFTKNAMANATKHSRAVLVASREPSPSSPSASVTRLNVMPLSGEPSTAVATMATNSSAEPAIV